MGGRRTVSTSHFQGKRRAELNYVLFVAPTYVRVDALREAVKRQWERRPGRSERS